MVFGVFDGLHQGHKYFLARAAERCEKLIVVVALSEIVCRLKGHSPRYEYAKRVAALLTFNPELRVISGDKTLGTWTVIRKHAPRVVLLGYDQQALAGELATLHVPCVFLDAHHPEKHKSSIIHGRPSE